MLSFFPHFHDLRFFHTFHLVFTLSSPLDMAALDGTFTMKSASLQWPSNKGGGSIRGGAGGGDAFTLNEVELRKKAREEGGGGATTTTTMMRSKATSSPDKALGKSLKKEVEVGGIFIPDTNLTRVSEVSYVLNQEPGRLRTKDIKRAIEEKKAGLSSREEELHQVMQEGLGGS